MYGISIPGGSNVAKEYYAMPEKTAEDFFTDNGKRWFRCGQLLLKDNLRQLDHYFSTLWQNSLFPVPTRQIQFKQNRLLFLLPQLTTAW